MRFLFLPLITRGAAIGTITRCLAIADHLRTLGHEPCFLTNGHGAEYVAHAGYPYVHGAIPDAPGPHHPLHDLSDVAVFLNLTKEDYLRRALHAELEAIDRFKPDALFSEFKLTAPITASETGLPLVSTACSPADPRFRSELFDIPKTIDHSEAIEGFNTILNERGLAPIEDTAELFFGRSDAKVAPTIVDLEPLLDDVPNLEYAGYLLYDRMESAPLPAGLMEATHGRRVVFAYFSAGDVGPDQYTDVLPKAFDDTEFHVICATGDHPALPTAPPPTSNTTWVRFVPGRSILERSDAIIFHGGQNTAMAALIHKVPAVIIPGDDFERDFNARAAARLGAAIHLSTDEFTPTRLREATREALNPKYTEAAEKLGSKALRRGGPRRAAEILIRRAEILAAS